MLDLPNPPRSSSDIANDLLKEPDIGRLAELLRELFEAYERETHKSKD